MAEPVLGATAPTAVPPGEGSASADPAGEGGNQPASPPSSAISDPSPPPEGTAAPAVVQWKTMIPETHRDAKVWEKFGDDSDGFSNLLKSHAEQQKLVGSKLTIPGEGDEAGWEALYNQLGRPEEATGYTVTWPDYDGKLDWNDDLKTAVCGMAHKHGLSQTQLNGLVDWFSQTTAEGLAAQEAANSAALDELRRSYGAAADSKFAQANELLRQAGGSELLEAITSSGLGANAVFVQSMIRLAEGVGDDSTFITNVAGLSTKADALSRINEIRGNREHPYHRGDANAIREVERLYQLAYAEPA